MRQDSRLSRMLHVLLHMDRHDRALTSEAIAALLNTNPVVIRRTMAGLREKKLVQSEKGHGGGWRLARPLDSITLLDVYEALGEPPVFALGPAIDHPDCLVEQSVNATLEAALEQARACFLSRLRAATLADLAADFDRRWRERQCG